MLPASHIQNVLKQLMRAAIISSLYLKETSGRKQITQYRAFPRDALLCSTEQLVFRFFVAMEVGASEALEALFLEIEIGVLKSRWQLRVQNRQELLVHAPPAQNPCIQYPKPPCPELIVLGIKLVGFLGILLRPD
jgi:hypothetical protein